MAVTTDFIHAWRGLSRRRAYPLGAAATLALVLGANAAVFAVVNATLLRPMPFPPGAEVVQVFMAPPGLTDRGSRNPPQQMDLVRLRERARTMTRLEGFLVSDRVVTAGGEPTVVTSATVTPGLIDMLQMRMDAGRAFTESEGRTGTRAAVITEGYWQRALGERPVLGTPLIIDGEPHTIVGILGRGHPPPFIRAEILVPLVPDAAPIGRNPARSVVTLAELAPSATVAAASAEVAEIVRQLATEFPRTHTGWSGGAQSVREWQFGQVRTPLLMLFGAALLVLVIACVNLANLASGHAIDRAEEISLRIALGATRARLLRLQAAELTIITAAGLVPGLVLSAVALPWLLALDPVAARSLGPVVIDWRVQLFAVLAAVVTVAMASFLPSLGRATAIAAIGGRRIAGSAGARLMRRVLVTGQVTLCLALLMAGAVLLRGLATISRHDPGFDARGVMAAEIRLPQTAYDTTERRAAVVSRILEAVRAVPGIESASTTMNPFVPGFTYQLLFHVENRPTPDGQPHTTLFRRVSPGYFSTMRIREVSGRTFTDGDTLHNQAVAVISRQLAADLFPGEDPLGRVLRRTPADAPPIRIIGVVDDVRDVSLTQAPAATIYLPWSQNNNSGVPVSLVVRTALDPVSLAPAVQAAVGAVDPSLPLRNPQALATFLSDSVAPERFRAAVLGVIGALGLTLAALGIYAVTYRGIVERTHEFAVRLALGSGRGDLLRLVLGDALRDVMIGVVLGFVAGLALTAAMQQAETHVAPGDPVTTTGAVGILLAAALGASLIPTLRILRVAPADALTAR